MAKGFMNSLLKALGMKSTSAPKRSVKKSVKRKAPSASKKKVTKRKRR